MNFKNNSSIAGYFLCLLSLSLMVSCAHHKDVRAGADGIHHVLVRAEHKEGAERKAIKEANHYCKEVQNGKHAVFVFEKTDYTGSMDEETRDIIKNVSTAAMMVGNRVDPMQTSGIGAAGMAGYMMTSGNDYAADMKFKCE